MSWQTPNPDFKVSAFLKSNISKTVCFGEKLLEKQEIIDGGSIRVGSNDIEWPCNAVCEESNFLGGS